MMRSSLALPFDTVVAITAATALAALAESEVANCDTALTLPLPLINSIAMINFQFKKSRILKPVGLD
jgi:hypothetical protein